jgi:hypothetical protein
MFACAAVIATAVVMFFSAQQQPLIGLLGLV